MIYIRDDVRIHGLRPEALLALIIADQTLDARSHDLLVTSVIEGVHGRGSLHFIGAAFDFIARARPGQIVDHALIGEPVAADLRSRLGCDFDILWEGGPRAHWHCEFQPKSPYA